LELRHGFGWERAGIAPLLELWDEDSNGALSSDEISAARSRLASCDLNEDDTVELREITRSQPKGQSTRRGWTPPRLIAVLDQETDWSALARDLARAYPTGPGNSEQQLPWVNRLANRLGANAAAPLASHDLEKSIGVPPDVALRICFGESDSMPAGVVVTELDPEIGAADRVLGASKDVIVVELADSYIEISAAESAELSGQVSCGAVVDGYPLMRHLDGDGDHRFSLREMQQVSDALAGFDRDGNDQIDVPEIRTPIRLAFAQGPNVHSMLAEPSGAAIREQNRPKREAPIWFTPMDANSDGDVARAEFFGTDEQFRRLDADDDGLVSVAEAIAAEPAGADSNDHE
jgi:Ca2+-binding EF-hand superfamily protein